jgi:hypothetical protein
MPALPWLRHCSPAGFALEFPPGWSVQPDTVPVLIVANGDASQAVMVEHLPVEEGPQAASYVIDFLYPDARRMRARMRCKGTPRGNTIFAAIATEEEFPHGEAMLQRILDSYRSVEGEAPPSPAPQAAATTPAVPPKPLALSYVPFADPVAGTFTVDVPQGWRVCGGFHHAGLGDRRLWVEAQSPDGIVILRGDPTVRSVSAITSCT